MKLIDTKPGQRFLELVAAGMPAAKAVVDAGFADPARALKTLQKALKQRAQAQAELPDHEVRRLALRKILSDPRAGAHAQLEAAKQLRILEAQLQRAAGATPRSDSDSSVAPAPLGGAALLETVERLFARAPAAAEPPPSAALAAAEPPPAADPAPAAPAHASEPEPPAPAPERERGPASAPLQRTESVASAAQNVPPTPEPPAYDAQAEQARIQAELLAWQERRRAPPAAERPRPPTFTEFAKAWAGRPLSELRAACLELGHQLQATDREGALNEAFELVTGAPKRHRRVGPSPAERAQQERKRQERREREAAAAAWNSRQRLIAEWMRSDDDRPRCWAPPPPRLRIF